MIKQFASPGYNFMFDTKTGFFARWGKTKEEDPQFSPAGPELLDIEVSTICHRGCAWCYKSNTQHGKNMSLSTFKIILDKMPETLTQVAFGIGDIGANRDLWDMMRYCRSKNIVPNITINGDRMRVSDYKNLSELCGAVAVSCYDRDTCYHTVEKLNEYGLKQVNIHCLLSDETSFKCMQVLEDTKSDKRLENLNAVVFLSLKPKGVRNRLHRVTDPKFKLLVGYALEHQIRLGFDSCTANRFLGTIQGHPNQKEMEMSVEPCESGLFSFYINTDGMGFPCSFSEGNVTGIDVVACKSFLDDVWNNQKIKNFSNSLIANKRSCILYDV